MSELSHVETDAVLLVARRTGEDARVERIMRDRHWFMLTSSISVIILSCVLRVSEGGFVETKLLTNVKLPGMCGSRALFGIECPGCGLTRSFVSLAGGDLRESLSFHPLGWLLALSVVSQIPYRIYLLRELRYRIPDRRWPTWYGNFLISLLLGNWLINQIT